jgi:hypothetical protein
LRLTPEIDWTRDAERTLVELGKMMVTRGKSKSGSKSESMSMSENVLEAAN